jgi:serine/threonine-protein kinase
MGSVYLGQHELLGHKAALKILPRTHASQSSYLARFIREAQSAARLSHPNIARVVELEASGSINYMVMEYIEGTDLNAKVKQEGPLDVMDAVEYVRQAALGLHYAHEQGFVHRDIKPANLMLDQHGMVNILDLGLAKVREDDDEAASLTQEFNEKVLGTADYLAPEQTVNSHDVDRRSDIYSLGCTLYFLLIGRAPFATGSVKDRMRAQRHTTPPNPLEKRPEIPAAIAEVYFRMMEKDPAARQQTAQEVADSLKAWLGQQALAAQRPRGDVPRRTPVRRSGDSSTTMPRMPPPGKVFRSGPSSRSGSGPKPPPGPGRSSSGSNVGPELSGLAFKEPTLPKAARPSDSSAGSFPVVSVTPPKAGVPPTGGRGRPAPKAAKRRSGFTLPAGLRLSQMNYAGLPLGFWLVALMAVVAIIGLGIAVLTK